MLLTDTHAHLYSTKFDNDRKEMVQRALDAGVERIFLPAIDSETHDSQDELAAAFPGKIFSMMGLHPCSVQPDTIDREMEIIEQIGRAHV